MRGLAIGNPRPQRPMPRRLYRFTTERRTSVNRYLLTLDFPWSPPPPNPLATTLAAATPCNGGDGGDSSLACSRFLLRGVAARPPLSFFRLSAVCSPPCVYRHPSPEVEARIGGGKIAGRRGTRGSYENI